MKQNKHSLEAGFSHVHIFLVIIVIAGVGFAGWRVLGANKNTSTSETTASQNEADDRVKAAAWADDTEPLWVADGRGGWISTPYEMTPPDCPDPITVSSPTPQLDKATALLYPGQTRQGTFEGIGGNYKPHGGLRFDKSTSKDVKVVMPFDGYVLRGSRYLIEGEIQYGFDFVNACGIMVRLGHLRELTPALAAIADKFPAATEGDSRTTKVEPVITFKQGDEIATAVGFQTPEPDNTFFDFGLYDLRSYNTASSDATYKQAHTADGELAYHALCWLDNLNPTDSKIVKALSAGDGSAGKTSDYCK